MIEGRFSDGQRVRTSDGREGIVTKSLGHWATAPDAQGRMVPDASKGPHYEVLINGRAVQRDGRSEWHGDEYLIVQDEDLTPA